MNRSENALLLGHLASPKWTISQRYIQKNVRPKTIKVTYKIWIQTVVFLGFTALMMNAGYAMYDPNFKGYLSERFPRVKKAFKTLISSDDGDAPADTKIHDSDIATFKKEIESRK